MADAVKRKQHRFLDRWYIYLCSRLSAILWTGSKQNNIVLSWHKFIKRKYVYLDGLNIVKAVKKNSTKDHITQLKKLKLN